MYERVKVMMYNCNSSMVFLTQTNRKIVSIVALLIVAHYFNSLITTKVFIL